MFIININNNEHMAIHAILMERYDTEKDGHRISFNDTFAEVISLYLNLCMFVCLFVLFCFVDQEFDFG